MVFKVALDVTEAVVVVVQVIGGESKQTHHGEGTKVFIAVVVNQLELDTGGGK